jgi:hypothetical protein|tara:strand:- start:985 stop:1149 length:165 start_codon:yes stop_codon:yes gene_type:complete
MRVGDLVEHPAGFGIVLEVRDEWISEFAYQVWIPSIDAIDWFRYGVLSVVNERR